MGAIQETRVGAGHSREPCFVICALGERGSVARTRADKLLKYVIIPAIEERLDIVRWDDISRPGVITTQIVEHLLNDPLVIADLSDGNPNVCYELGIRHMTRKPVVHLIHRGMPIPFDNRAMRAIEYVFDVEEIESCKQELANQVKTALETPEAFASPVSICQDLLALQRKSAHSLRVDEELAALVPMLQSLIESMTGETETGEGGYPPAMVRRLLVKLRRIVDGKK